MTGLLAISVLIIVPALVAYGYCYYSLHQLIATEKPEWLEHNGFFGRRQSPTNANVAGQVLAVAFTNRVKLLSAPALDYAIAMRILLPIYAVAFGVIAWFLIRAFEP